jgi:hypothetical protein
MQAQAAIRKAVEDAKLGGRGRKDAGLGRLKLLQIVCRLARPRLNLLRPDFGPSLEDSI